MKKISILVMALGISMAFASCNKCVTCSDCDQGVTVDNGGELCEDDFTSEAEYDLTVSVAESFGGCTCD